VNPRWEDLTRDWQNVYKPDCVTRREILSARWRKRGLFGITPFILTDRQPALAPTLGVILNGAVFQAE